MFRNVWWAVFKWELKNETSHLLSVYGRIRTPQRQSRPDQIRYCGTRNDNGILMKLNIQIHLSVLLFTRPIYSWNLKRVRIMLRSTRPWSNSMMSSIGCTPRSTQRETNCCIQALNQPQIQILLKRFHRGWQETRCFRGSVSRWWFTVVTSCASPSRLRF